MTDEEHAAECLWPNPERVANLGALYASGRGLMSVATKEPAGW
jgi:hypothetical protein